MCSLYSPPTSWYEPECESSYDCKHCEEKDERFQDAKDHLKEVVKQLYSKEKLSAGDLENSLDELCYYFGMKTCQDDLQIQRPVQAKPEWLTNWVQFNNTYVKQPTH